MPKKYYWFKMRADFFDSREIKRLQKIPGGDTYIVLYINLLSRSVKTEGCLHFDHVEDTFAEELALILDSNAEAVNFLLKFLCQYNLLTIDGDNYYFIEAISHIGTESDAAERMRRSRQKKKEQLTSSQNEFKKLSSTTERNNVTTDCNAVTVDNSASQQCNNVTPRNDVTQTGNFVTQSSNKVTICNNVRDCYTEIEKEIEKEPSSSTKVNIDVSNPVDNFGLPVAAGFDAFLKCYPRSQANSEAVYQPFCQLINQGVAVSDLIAAAKGYADAVRNDNADPRYIKMPANFLSQQIWLKYKPKFQLDCPTCHGNGVVDCPPSDEYPNGHVEFCRCQNRYKSFEPSNVMYSILAKLSGSQ
jgi:predicted phage replisome organizer